MVQAWPDRIRAVTADAVQAAARQWLDRRRSVTGYLVQSLKPQTLSPRRSIRERNRARFVETRPPRRGRDRDPASGVVASAAPASATTIERVVSASGIEAWLVHEPAVPLIAIDFAFSGGAAQDPAGKAGVAYLAASTLNDGVGEFDSKTFHERLERKAIELEFQRRPRRAARLAAHADGKSRRGVRGSAAVPDRAALRRRRRRARSRANLSALRRATTSPNDIANQRWWDTAFAGHPYGRPANGTLESVPNITVDDLKAYAHRVLARDKLKIAVVGDIDAEAVKTMLDRVFGALPAKAELTPVADVVPQGLGRRIVVSLDVPQAVVEFGGAGIARKDPDFMAAYIVNHILGGGSFSSRLYQEVREKRGLAYGVSDSLLWFDHTALFLGSTATRADRTGETLDLIEKEIRRLAEDGPTAKELAKAKAYLNGSFALGLDTSSKIARHWCRCSSTISASTTSRGGRR